MYWKVIMEKIQSIVDQIVAEKGKMPIPLFLREVGKYSYYGILRSETCNNTRAWREFENRLLRLRSETFKLISELVRDGKTVYGYGASTKGNTLLQFYGLDNTLIHSIAERQPIKYGKVTGGTNIPIISEQEFRESNPDYVLVLPWHFESAILEREQELLARGTKFIFPLPELKIVGK